MQGQNYLKLHSSESLYWELAFSDILGPFDNWLPLETFDNAGRIWLY